MVEPCATVGRHALIIRRARTTTPEACYSAGLFTRTSHRVNVNVNVNNVLAMSDSDVCMLIGHVAWINRIQSLEEDVIV